MAPGYPTIYRPVDAKAEKILAKRTVTELYNEPKPWLQDAHRALDEAVARAYEWSPDLNDEEVVKRLLALNLERPSRNSGDQDDEEDAEGTEED
ncbi:MAG: hypothetical protein ACXU86_21570 [Archangium sp.]